jgi:hypothetical protein
MANDRTEGRRERVRELYAKNNRRLAEILIDEGFFGPRGKTAEARGRQLDTARRQVLRDRDFWRTYWRTQRKVSIEDRNVTIEEYIAKLETRIEQLEEMLDDPKLKATPRVQAMAELRQLEQAIAKARGIGDPSLAAADVDGEGNARPFLGVVVNLGKVSAEAVKKIEEFGAGAKQE